MNQISLMPCPYETLTERRSNGAHAQILQGAIAPTVKETGFLQQLLHITTRSPKETRFLATTSPDPDRAIWLASAEDIILQKLIWYRMGNRVSDRQWRDILGVLKVQGESLDLEYLTDWAKMLELEEMMTQALRSSGLGE